MIRPMCEGDHTALLSIWESFPGNALTGADGLSGFTNFLERNGEFCFCAWIEDRLIGSVMAGHDTRRGYIYHLAVDAALHGRGIGAALMEECETSLLDAGIEKIHLFIFKDNPAAGFYERIGWHTRENILVMSKVLNGEQYMGSRRAESD